MTAIVRGTRTRLAERLAYLYRHDVGDVLAGTVATDGTINIVGTGTAFLTGYSNGAMMHIEGEQRRVVAAVADNTHLTLTEAAVTTATGLAHANNGGLFEFCDGSIGGGSIDAPDIAARIEVWPYETIPSDIKATPTIIVQAVRPSGVFEALPSKVDEPVYELLATLFVRTLPQRLVAGALNTDDVYLHMRDVAMRGDNTEVPGLLKDPDLLTRTLNVYTSGINEDVGVRFNDVTLYPLRLAYTVREDIRTGALK